MKRYLLTILLLLPLFSSLPLHAEYQAICNQEYLPQLEKMLKNAQTSISIMGLSMDNKWDVNKKIIAHLKDAQQRSVKVRVLLECNKGGLAEQNLKTLEVLGKLGIAAKADSENHITHAKLIIADTTVLVGSTNLSYSSMLKNNESNILIKSQDGFEFYQKYFDSMWKDSSKTWDLQQQSQDQKSIYFADKRYLKIALDHFSKANKIIKVMMYMVMQRTDIENHVVQQLLDALIAAKKRGVVVRIVFEQSYPGAFNAHIDQFNKQAAEYLKNNGVQDIVFDDPKQITHSKIVCVDSSSIIISSNNWYDKGLLVHHQAGISTTDQKTVAKIEQYFDKIYQECKNRK